MLEKVTLLHVFFPFQIPLCGYFNGQANVEGMSLTKKEIMTKKNASADFSYSNHLR